MLEAALDEEVAKSVDHEWVGLTDNCFNDFVFLLSCSDLELLLKENGRLLIIAADNLIHDVFPITRDILIKKASVIERLMG